MKHLLTRRIREIPSPIKPSQSFRLRLRYLDINAHIRRCRDIQSLLFPILNKLDFYGLAANTLSFVQNWLRSLVLHLFHGSHYSTVGNLNSLDFEAFRHIGLLGSYQQRESQSKQYFSHILVLIFNFLRDHHRILSRQACKIQNQQRSGDPSQKSYHYALPSISPFFVKSPPITRAKIELC
jgi:hypothetical protein